MIASPRPRRKEHQRRSPVRGSQTDPAVADAYALGAARERDSVELIASENFTSPVVMEAGAACSEQVRRGYPRKRYYGGCEKVDRWYHPRERALPAILARTSPTCSPTGANANHGRTRRSSSWATVLGMSLAGRPSHARLAGGNPSGRHYDFASYGVDAQTETIDYDEVERIAKEVRPKLIVGGQRLSAHHRLRAHGRHRARGGAAHHGGHGYIAGLVAAGTSPVPHADVVISPLQEPARLTRRGGFILSNDEDIAKRIDRPCSRLAGRLLMHVIAGRAVAFGEAAQPAYKEYIKHHVVGERAHAGAGAAMDGGPPRRPAAPTNHLCLVNLTPAEASGCKGCRKLVESVAPR